MRPILTFFVFTFFLSTSKAQSFAINTDGSAANNSAILDVKSTTKGMLIPRMNKTQRNVIAAPANGLLVYVTGPDTTGFSFYTATQWKWVEEKNDNNWSINGNYNTNPSMNYIGTNDYADLVFKTWMIERMRLTNEAELGVGENDPKYTVDLRTGSAAINNCSTNGLRIKNFAASNNCETGFVLGYPIASSEVNNGLVWNYGNVNGASPNLLFGVGYYERMRLTNDGFLGIGTILPKYSLDVFTGTAAVNPCYRNGLRIKTPDGQTSCDLGTFLGYSDPLESEKISLWNLSANGFTSNQYIRFGFGANDSDGPFSSGEALRILPPGNGVGIGIRSPLAMVHISNSTGGGVMPGVMVTSPFLSSTSNGFYTGLQLTGPSNDAYVWNYQNAPICFGTSNFEQMRISENGYVGIGTTHPDAPLQFAEVYRNDKLVLHNNNHGWGLINEHDFFGFGVNSQVLRYQIPRNNTAHVFYAGTSLGTASIELMRITGDGYVGIGMGNPVAPLQFSDMPENRKIVLAGFGVNNDHNFFGFGRSLSIGINELRYQVSYNNDDHVFYAGDNGGFTSTELMRVKGNGNVGIGTNNPTQKLHVNGNILASGTITPSDIRYKKNIHTINNALDKVQQLDGVTYQLNTTAFPEWKFEEGQQYGLIAQEVEKVFPEMVKTIDANGYKGVDYVKLVPVLIEAIKEQQKQIEELKKQIKNK